MQSDPTNEFEPAFEEQPSQASPRPIRTIVLVVSLVVVFAAAAFLAGRLLNNRVAASGTTFTLPGGDGNMEFTTKEIRMERAEELPERQPDLSGLFDSRQDNSIFIRTMSQGAIVVEAVVSDNGEDGETGSINIRGENEDEQPPTEVLITNDTQVFRDVTMTDSLNAPDDQQGVQTVTQVLEAGNADEIDDNSIISVWGRKSGDRMIADILVYTPALIMTGP